MYYECDPNELPENWSGVDRGRCIDRGRCLHQTSPARRGRADHRRAGLASGTWPAPLRADPSFPPIEWFGDNGTYRGLVADYFQLSRPVSAFPSRSSGCLPGGSSTPSLRTEVDGITAAQATPERSTYLDWTPSIIDTPNMMIVRAGTSGGLSLEGLSGKRVAVTAGYAIEEYLQRTTRAFGSYLWATTSPA